MERLQQFVNNIQENKFHKPDVCMVGGEVNCGHLFDVHGTVHRDIHL